MKARCPRCGIPTIFLCMYSSYKNPPEDLREEEALCNRCYDLMEESRRRVKMRQISVEIISYTHDLTDLRMWLQSEPAIKEAGWILEQHVIVSGMYDQIFLARELTPEWLYLLHKLTVYIRERFGLEHLDQYQIDSVTLIDQ